MSLTKWSFFFWSFSFSTLLLFCIPVLWKIMGEYAAIWSLLIWTANTIFKLKNWGSLLSRRQKFHGILLICIFSPAEEISVCSGSLPEDCWPNLSSTFKGRAIFWIESAMQSHLDKSFQLAQSTDTECQHLFKAVHSVWKLTVKTCMWALANVFVRVSVSAGTWAASVKSCPTGRILSWVLLFSQRPFVVQKIFQENPARFSRHFKAAYSCIVLNHSSQPTWQWFLPRVSHPSFYFWSNQRYISWWWNWTIWVACRQISIWGIYFLARAKQKLARTPTVEMSQVLRWLNKAHAEGPLILSSRTSAYPSAQNSRWLRRLNDVVGFLHSDQLFSSFWLCECMQPWFHNCLGLSIPLYAAAEEQFSLSHLKKLESVQMHASPTCHPFPYIIAEYCFKTSIHAQNSANFWKWIWFCRRHDRCFCVEASCRNGCGVYICWMAHCAK